MKFITISLNLIIISLNLIKMSKSDTMNKVKS